MAIEKPPPVIGKIGYYTVFITPNSKSTSELPHSGSHNPVQPPPVDYHNSGPSKFGFFWDALTTLQNVHSSLDEYLAHWFGLNQSKYQWALDDYYQNNTMVKVDSRAKDIPKTDRYNMFVVSIYPKRTGFEQRHPQEHCSPYLLGKTSVKGRSDH